MTIKYIADFTYGTATLAQVEVEKETPKTISIKGKWLNLINQRFYLPNRLNKGDYYIYDTEAEAIAWLVSQAEAYQESLEKMLVKAEAQVKELREYLNDNQA